MLEEREGNKELMRKHLSSCLSQIEKLSGPFIQFTSLYAPSFPKLIPPVFDSSINLGEIKDLIDDKPQQSSINTLPWEILHKILEYSLFPPFLTVKNQRTENNYNEESKIRQTINMVCILWRSIIQSMTTSCRLSPIFPRKEHSIFFLRSCPNYTKLREISFTNCKELSDEILIKVFDSLPRSTFLNKRKPLIWESAYKLRERENKEIKKNGNQTDFQELEKIITTEIRSVKICGCKRITEKSIVEGVLKYCKKLEILNLTNQELESQVLMKIFQTKWDTHKNEQEMVLRGIQHLYLSKGVKEMTWELNILIALKMRDLKSLDLSWCWSYSNSIEISERGGGGGRGSGKGRGRGKGRGELRKNKSQNESFSCDIKTKTPQNGLNLKKLRKSSEVRSKKFHQIRSRF